MNDASTKQRQSASQNWLLAGAALVCLTAVTHAQFDTPKRLDTNTLPGASESDGIALTSVGQTIHAAWFEISPITGRDIYYTRSFDAGGTWEAPRRIDLDPGVGNQEFPVLLAEGQTVALAWLDDRITPTVQDVYGRFSQDGGASFGPEIALTGPLTGDLADADNLVGAISLPYISFCFEDNKNATDLLGKNEDAIVVTSGNSGLSFGLPTRANHPLGGAGSADIDSPAIGAVGSTIHVAWVDRRNGIADKVFINSSLDGGVSFAAGDTRLDTTIENTADANNPRMAVSGNNVIVTWRDNRLNPLSTAKKLYMNASVDGGASFLGEARLDSAGLTANAKSGKISISGNRFVIGWIDDRNDPLGALDDVYIRTGSLRNGILSLGSERRLDQTIAGTSDNGSVKVAYRGKAIYVMYQDSRNDPMNLNDGLYLRSSVNAGASFRPEINLTPSLTGLLDVEGDELVVTPNYDVIGVWGDNRNGTGLLPPNDVFSSKADLPPSAAFHQRSTYKQTKTP